MPEEKDLEFLARSLLPALIAAAGFWFLDLFEVRSSPFNVLLLVASYLVGFSLLLYAERSLRLPKTAGFYAFYALLVAAGILMAGTMIAGSPAWGFQSFALLPALMLILPVVFQVLQERVANVQPE